jgi:lia operon protein LiaF
MKSNTNRIIGGLIIAVGALILIDNFFGGFNFWDFIWRLWPLALIILGVYIIKNQNKIKGGNKPGDASSENTILGDLNISLNGQEVSGHHYSSLIGDVKIDMRGAKFTAGENSISVFSLIGDIRIEVPENLPVKLSTHFLIGDVRFDDLRRDGFFQRLDHADDNYGSSEKKLHLTVNGVVGDLNVERIKIEDVN